MSGYTEGMSNDQAAIKHDKQGEQGAKKEWQNHNALVLGPLTVGDAGQSEAGEGVAMVPVWRTSPRVAVQHHVKLSLREYQSPA